MKLLVVNADDLGADPGRNRGIFEALGAGVATSVSVLANGPALGDAAARLRTLGEGTVSVGLHVNLSEGEPLVSGHRFLVGPDGRFLGKWRAHERLGSGPDPELRDEVAKEVEAQVAALRCLGLEPDHLDGHQHVHVLPAVLEAAVGACLRHGIPWFRLPEEAEPEPAVDLGSPPRRFSAWACRARPAVEAAGLFSPTFRGLHAVSRLDEVCLGALVSELPDGLTELMVHPGRSGADGIAGPFSGFSTPDRDRELDALLGTRFRAALEAGGVTLTGFPRRRPPEGSCAS